MKRFTTGLIFAVATLSAACGDKNASSDNASQTLDAESSCETQATSYADANWSSFSGLTYNKKWKRAYKHAFDQCEGSTTGELPLVRTRTNIAAGKLQQHLSQVPSDVLAITQCVMVISSNNLGWGLSGGERGAGLVSCRTHDGWSAPSYVSLHGLTIGPSIGIIHEDTTFLYTQTDAHRAYSSQFDITAQVYATAGSAAVSLSAATDGCIRVDLLHTTEINCTVGISDSLGLAAGANVEGIVVRHMNGIFGGGLIGRNKRVYGSGVSVSNLLNTPAANVSSGSYDIIKPWVQVLNTYAP